MQALHGPDWASFSAAGSGFEGAAADDDYFEERAKALRVLLMPRRAVYNDEWEWEKVEKEEGRGGKGW
ncbi:MAG: hypothetical protein GY739_18050, partial [Mesoflavibacter sp.]|nr:hypothetical protein [Mesoflavibacter sp.]